MTVAAPRISPCAVRDRLTQAGGEDSMRKVQAGHGCVPCCKRTDALEEMKFAGVYRWRGR